jgi:methylated-DNA-protein-cysteine methyltransferase-like protein
MGAFSVEMGRFGWFPEVLPSEEGEDSDEDEDEVAGSSEDPDSEGVEEPEA